MLTIQKHWLMFSFVILISNISFPNLVLAESNFTLEKGVWIEYEDWWSEEHKAQWPVLGIWYRVDIESVEGNTLTYKWTMRTSGGGEQTYTSEDDIEDGYWGKGIPPDLRRRQHQGRIYYSREY